MIRIHIPPTPTPHAAAYIYSHSDAFTLRKHHRLLGDFLGTLPKHTAQNQYQTLPLALSYDEAHFGLSRNILTPLPATPTTYATTPAATAAFFAARAHHQHTHLTASIAHQAAQRARHAPTRKRPREHPPADNPDPDPPPPPKRPRTSLLARVSRRLRAAAHYLIPRLVPAPLHQPHPLQLQPPELQPPEQPPSPREAALQARLRQQARATALVITSTEARPDELAPRAARPAPLHPPPGVPPERLRSRAAVFADLHDRGYYLSCGAKFGADFLAYAGDPQLFHAALAVVVVEADECVSPLDVVALGRLGDSTKKRTVLAFLEGGVVRYVGVQWEETLP